MSTDFLEGRIDDESRLLGRHIFEDLRTESSFSSCLASEALGPIDLIVEINIEPRAVFRSNAHAAPAIKPAAFGIEVRIGIIPSQARPNLHTKAAVVIGAAASLIDHLSICAKSADAVMIGGADSEHI